MSDYPKDTNGIPIKPGHTGHQGPPIGPTVWLIERHDHKCFGPFESRHDALAASVLMHDCDDYDMVPIPAGSFRFDDVVIYHE